MKRSIQFKTILLFIPLFLIGSSDFAQNNYLLHTKKETLKDSLEYYQIKTDSLFGSKQIISILELPKRLMSRIGVEFGYYKHELKRTSSFGIERDAAAAVNGSYFDIDKGGGVTYFEVNDSVIDRTRAPKNKWAKPNTLINGAIILDRNNNVLLQPVKPDRFYEKSKKEKAVLVSGPLLMLNSKEIKLPAVAFVTKRHPRTVLGITRKSLLFITIDGRSKEADGMSLTEVQKLIKDLGCTDAINLDGGGSTTMWIKNKGIVNYPSDAAGERPVSNVLFILDN